MEENGGNIKAAAIRNAPMGLAILAMLGPSLIWCAEFIGSGEVILATRTGAILGMSVLWAVVVGIFLKYWIGMSGARYTVCTGEGMVDMFDRIPGPRHWVVWLVLVIQFGASIVSIASLANAAGLFVHSLVPLPPVLCGWAVSLFALMVVWSGLYNVLKIVMSIFVLVIVLGVMYVAVHIFPSFGQILEGMSFRVPAVPAWALQYKGVTDSAWSEILPLLGWGAGGFASQVWYTYWVLGAGYGAAAGRGYGRPADVTTLRSMSRETAKKIKGWCSVLYTDATLAVVIGIVVTSAFFIAGAGILGPKEKAPQGVEVAVTLSELFSSNWGRLGGLLFMLSGAAALIATQVGQLAGWPRLLADSCRICIPGFKKIPWKWQYRSFLVMFFLTSITIVYTLGLRPVALVKMGALFDGLLLTPLQALWTAVGLFVVMPKVLSKEAAKVLRPNPVFAVGLIIAFLVFGYFCVFQLPSALFGG